MIRQTAKGRQMLQAESKTPIFLKVAINSSVKQTSPSTDGDLIINTIHITFFLLPEVKMASNPLLPIFFCYARML